MAHVLPHPWSPNFSGDAIRILRCRELENQDQVRLVDLRDTSRERACVDHELHAVPRRLNGRSRHRFAQTEVVDDNVQQLDAIACRKYLLAGDPGTPTQGCALTSDRQASELVNHAESIAVRIDEDNEVLIRTGIALVARRAKAQ